MEGKEVRKCEEDKEEWREVGRGRINTGERISEGEWECRMSVEEWWDGLNQEGKESTGEDEQVKISEDKRMIGELRCCWGGEGDDEGERESDEEYMEKTDTTGPDGLW